MIVHTTIDIDGAVTVTLDSDGDQGDAYSTEVLDDMLKRAAQKAVNVWVTIHRHPDDHGVRDGE